jgi:hypothetical protein
VHELDRFAERCGCLDDTGRVSDTEKGISSQGGKLQIELGEFSEEGSTVLVDEEQQFGRLLESRERTISIPIWND